MVSRLDFDLFKNLFQMSPKESRRQETSPRSITLHVGHHKRWHLKRNTDPSTSQPTFCWTKTKN